MPVNRTLAASASFQIADESLELSVGGKELEVGRSGLSSSKGLLDDSEQDIADFEAPRSRLKLKIESRPVVIRDLNDPMHEPPGVVTAHEHSTHQNSLLIAQKRKSGVFKASQIHEMLGTSENTSPNGQ